MSDADWRERKKEREREREKGGRGRKRERWREREKEREKEERESESKREREKERVWATLNSITGRSIDVLIGRVDCSAFAVWRTKAALNVFSRNEISGAMRRDAAFVTSPIRRVGSVENCRYLPCTRWLGI